jgi:cell division protein FtsB
MPKLVLVIIFTAFSLLLGLFLGAFMTKPQNAEMEKLVMDKIALVAKVEKLEQENQGLKTQCKNLENNTMILRENIRSLSKVLRDSSEKPSDTSPIPR